ncbi:hypothetical protein QS460_03635 [Liquorilactobacillus mali]|uniref:Uncharacterized protein n=1 Tax=Liquorilactobacillus mali TaxID=1618 RepID=A0A0R2FYC7_9LACO|nr:hypothetical protein [Liquorilactobacillus mali]KRN33168.1 hypothetical protein IV36_GL000903 [Liquorilactobacillus mali]MDN7145017.1 hypothetical protein [Liquorilactobacillus mali]
MSENNSEFVFENIQFDVRKTVIKKYVFITHYSENNINALRTSDKKIRFYLSQELYTLIQKLIRFGFIDKLQSQPKIIPAQYPQRIDGVEITAYKNDDSLYGSLAFLINSPSKSIFYCHSFTNKGAHSKRLKNWKKVIRQNQPSSFYLDAKMYTNNSHTIISETGIQKQFGKFISHVSADAPAKVLFSPLNPERLAKYNETAREHDRIILWQREYAELLNFFFPDDEFLTSFSKDEQNLAVIQQVDTKLEIIDAENNYTDPMLRPVTAANYPTKITPLITPIDDNSLLQLKQDLKIEQIIFW